MFRGSLTKGDTVDVGLGFIHFSFYTKHRSLPKDDSAMHTHIGAINLNSTARQMPTSGQLSELGGCVICQDNSAIFKYYWDAVCVDPGPAIIARLRWRHPAE